jgi:WD40 repeat protein
VAGRERDQGIQQHWEADLTRWDFVVDEPVWTAKGADADTPYTIDVSRDGRWVLTGSLDGNLTVWDAVQQRSSQTNPNISHF